MREAPEAVVAAMLEARERHRYGTWTEDGRQCWCGENFTSLREAEEHRERKAADAAWAVAYPAALRDAADRVEQRGRRDMVTRAHVHVLRRWADESEADRA